RTRRTPRHLAAAAGATSPAERIPPRPRRRTWGPRRPGRPGAAELVGASLQGTGAPPSAGPPPTRAADPPSARPGRGAQYDGAACAPVAPPRTAPCERPPP